MTESKSDRNSILTWFFGSLASIAAVGTGAMYVSSNENAYDAPRSLIASPQQVTLIDLADRARELRIRGPLFDFFGIPPYINKDTTSKSDTAKSEEENKIEVSRIKEDLDNKLAEYQLEFMIVTVADPIDAGENYMFDQQLDAIQKGASVDPKDRWLYSGSYLPWQVYRNRSSQDSKISLIRSEHWYQDEPGVLLFRKQDKDGNHLLLIYLVGELPTLGIQRDAFEHAMREINHLRTKGTKLAQEIRIIGPTFSGSAFSLQEAIRDYRSEYKHTSIEHEKPNQEEKRFIKYGKISVICGSATAIHPEDFRDCRFLGSTVCSFEATRQALRELVGNEQIAWLVESGTGFGAAFDDQNAKSNPSATNRPKPSNNSADTDEIDNTNATRDIVFHFPLEVSRVRKAFEQKQSIDRQQLMSLRPRGTVSRLPFDVDQEMRDVPTPQTPNMTTPEAELLLREILQTVKNLNIRYVSVMATDIRDTIFLADEIKLHCPGVQLLIPESDLLLAHPEYSDSLIGAIAASSYPLFPSGIIASQSHGDPIQLMSSQTSYGIYNAFRIHRLLERDRYALKDGVLELKEKPTNPYLIGYWNNRPNVWLQKIGNRCFSPLGLPKTYSLDRPPIRVDYYLLKQQEAQLSRLESNRDRFHFELTLGVCVLFAIGLLVVLPSIRWTCGKQIDMRWLVIQLISYFLSIHAFFFYLHFPGPIPVSILSGISFAPPLFFCVSSIIGCCYYHIRRLQFHDKLDLRTSCKALVLSFFVAIPFLMCLFLRDYSIIEMKNGVIAFPFGPPGTLGFHLFLLLAVALWATTLVCGILKVVELLARFGNYKKWESLLSYEKSSLEAFHEKGLKGVQRLLFGTDPELETKIDSQKTEYQAVAEFRKAHRELAGLRRYFQATITSSCLIFLSIASYPFTFGYLLRQVAVLAILSSLVFCLWSYLALERHPRLSPRLGTKPEEIAWNSESIGFLMRSAIPTFAIFAIQFLPGSWGWISQMLGPMMHAGK